MNRRPRHYQIPRTSRHLSKAWMLRWRDCASSLARVLMMKRPFLEKNIKAPDDPSESFSWAMLLTWINPFRHTSWGSSPGSCQSTPHVAHEKTLFLLPFLESASQDVTKRFMSCWRPARHTRDPQGRRGAEAGRTPSGGGRETDCRFTQPGGAHTQNKKKSDQALVQ